MTTPGITSGQTTATALLTQLTGAKLPGYAKLVCAMPALPPALTKVAETIKKESGRPVSDILMAAVRPDMAFRGAFAFRNPAAPQGNRTQEQVLRNMAVGTGDYAFDLPTLQLNQFVAGLFKEIAAKHPATKINERDLFHGHVIPNEAARDIVIVFHAKEYPVEEFGTGKQNMYRGLNLLTSGVADFATSGPVMDERNFVWTLSTNKVFLLTDPGRVKTPDPEFAKLMLDKHGGAPSSLTAKQAGTVQECNFGTELFVANYFPTHLQGGDDQQAFFTPVGQWGVLAKLEADFPHIPATEIAKIYASTDDSLNKTVPLLKAWK